MASMAVTDAVIGLVSMPLGIYVIATNGKWGLGDDLCQVWIWLDKILCTVSIYHVVCLSGDRYTAVCHPLRYRFMPKRTVYCLIAVCWTVPVTMTVLTVVSGWHHSGVEVLVECIRQSESCQAVYNTPFLLIISTTDFYIPFTVIFVVYFLVLRKIQVLPGTSIHTNAHASSESNVKPHRSRTKAYRTIGIIVLGFTVCWLPFSIFNVVAIYTGYSLPLWIILLFTWMGYVNSALNPIFFCFNKSVRQA
ncbi:unnamed protein product, partial [Lymnaea stagnalis]